MNAVFFLVRQKAMNFHAVKEKFAHISFSHTLERAANTATIVSTKVRDAFIATLYLYHEYEVVLRLLRA